MLIGFITLLVLVVLGVPVAFSVTFASLAIVLTDPMLSGNHRAATHGFRGKFIYIYRHTFFYLSWKSNEYWRYYRTDL